MNNSIKYGFIKPTIEDKHYVLGASLIEWEILRPEGQWIDCLPFLEMQRKYGVETYNCTGFGTNNPVEIILKRANFALSFDFSDRFTGIVADTKPPGNDPHAVAEAVRKNGFIVETMLPFSDIILSVADYFSFKGAVEKLCRKAAELWLTRYTFAHEWVWKGDIPLAEKQTLLKESLKYSPLGVSVAAWSQDGSGLYTKNPGDEDNHWTTMVGYVEGEYWIIFDSYPDGQGQEIKHLRWDFDFGFCKKYQVLPIGNSGIITVRNPFMALWGFITNLFKK